MSTETPLPTSEPIEDHESRHTPSSALAPAQDEPGTAPSPAADAVPVQDPAPDAPADPGVAAAPAGEAPGALAGEADTETLEPVGAFQAAAPVRAAVGQVLPIYFVGDESHSMSGDPIHAVNAGLAELRDEVARHPLIGKKVRFGILTFAHSAEVRLELSQLSEDLQLPTLAPRGRGTSYASAFELLRRTIPGDVSHLKSAGYQVHRPAVFFLTDGQPTEREKKWKSALADLADTGFRERPNILAFGVGEADPAVVAQIASSPRYAFMMKDGASTAGAIAEFATSMLNSMVASAEQLERGGQTIEFEKPEGFVQLDAPLL